MKKKKMKTKTHSIRHRTGYFWQNKTQIPAEPCIQSLAHTTKLIASRVIQGHKPYFDFVKSIKCSLGGKVYTLDRCTE